MRWGSDGACHSSARLATRANSTRSASAVRESLETRLGQIIAAGATAEQVTAAAHVLAALRAVLERENLGTPAG